MATILVVDDLASHRQLAAGLLSREPGFKVLFAANGTEALAQLQNHQADVVVSDVVMPEVNGLELLRAVCRDFPLIPVILMTATGSENLAVQALQEGAASYVPKRVLARRLVETVKSVLAASLARRTHSEIKMRLTLQELTFELENDIELILALPTYLNPYLQAAHLTDHLVRLRIHMALEEALVNALYHGNLEIGAALRDKNPDELLRVAALRAEQSPYRERRIHVRATLNPRKVQFTIRDEGPGFNTTTLPPAADVASLDSAHGRGVMLMRSFLDEVRYNETGNVVTLTKRLNSPPKAAAET